MKKTTKKKSQGDIVKVVYQLINGVRVVKNITRGGATFVDASCQCFGSKNRTHTNINCPNL